MYMQQGRTIIIWGMQEAMASQDWRVYAARKDNYNMGHAGSNDQLGLACICSKGG